MTKILGRGHEARSDVHEIAPGEACMLFLSINAPKYIPILSGESEGRFHR